MRRSANVDANQAELVAQLRKCGVSVQHLHGVGSGCPDLLVGWRGVNILLEVKDTKTPTKKCQEEWHAKWAGQSAIVRSFTEAMDAITAAGKQSGVA